MGWLGKLFAAYGVTALSVGVAVTTRPASAMAYTTQRDVVYDPLLGTATVDMLRWVLTVTQ